jgi:hypothetical protein
MTPLGLMQAGALCCGVITINQYVKERSIFSNAPTILAEKKKGRRP